METVGLVLESAPATSVFVAKTPGRISEKAKQHYNRHTSAVLVAHKTVDFTYNPVSKSDHFEEPRTQQWEAMGLVVSARHPPASTFLAPAMADHLLKRFVCFQDNCRVRFFVQHLYFTRSGSDHLMYDNPSVL